MPSLSNNILTVTEPTISLESFDMANIEEGEAYDKQFAKMSKFAGDQYPALRINRFDFNKDDVVDFELNLDGIVPYMKATVRDSKGTFTKLKSIINQVLPNCIQQNFFQISNC